MVYLYALMKYKHYHNTPVGWLEILSDTDFVCQINFVKKPVDGFNPKFVPPVVIECCKQLDEYFNGSRKQFEFAYKLLGTDFQIRVWQELEKIPYGTMVTYAEQAIKLGDVKSIRAVGTANGKNKLAIVVPCHRVVGTDGSLTGYAGGIDKKKWLLQHEMQYHTDPTKLF